MLTHKQQELLTFIQERMRESAVPPSYDEMRTALGLASKSGIHRLVSALEERGYIRRLPNRARAIEVLRLPESMQPRLSAVMQSSSRVASLAERRAVVQDIHASSIPMMGRIAAGTPIEAIQTASHSIAVPPGMVGPGEHYALEVRGDSMIEAGIFDGDTVIIKKQESASNGEIVVALVDGEEATLKRVRRKGDMIALEPANTSYTTRMFPPDRIKVQGRMVGLLRKY